jgi:hypothetical protein
LALLLFHALEHRLDHLGIAHRVLDVIGHDDLAVHIHGGLDVVDVPGPVPRRSKAARVMVRKGNLLLGVDGFAGVLTLLPRFQGRLGPLDLRQPPFPSR